MRNVEKHVRLSEYNNLWKFDIIYCNLQPANDERSNLDYDDDIADFVFDNDLFDALQRHSHEY